MAGRIRDEDIALVREKSAIDEVVGEYLQLRNAGGGSLKGLCPFHDEKTPSFNVTPARGLWYCFSCANGGDVIKFIQQIDNLSFVESVERLAARAGIDLRYEQGGQVPGREHSQRRRLLEAHKAAAEYYAEQLHSPAAAPGRARPGRQLLLCGQGLLILGASLREARSRIDGGRGCRGIRRRCRPGSVAAMPVIGIADDTGGSGSTDVNVFLLHRPDAGKSDRLSH